MEGAFAYLSPPYIVRPGLSLNLELMFWLCWLTSESSRIHLSLSPSTGVADTYCLAWLLYGNWGFELRSLCLCSEPFTH